MQQWNPMDFQQFRKRTREQTIDWLKERGRPALNAFLARYSLVGDPVVFETGAFPWARELERNWEAIADEARGVLRQRKHIPAFQEISPDQIRISNTDEWQTLWYRGFGYRSEVFARACPKTAALVDAVPEVETAFFSILAPGKHIIAHRGVFKGIVNYHLGLLIPRARERCRMRVADEYFHWEPGESRIFDDTNEHEVWNDTPEDRVVLMLQFHRPMRGLGRRVSRGFLALLKRTPYITVAIENQRASDERLRRLFDPS
jgi:beta-hydroxylase